MGKILIIENQHTQYKEIKGFLIEEGYEVFPTEKYSEAGVGYSQFMDLVQIYLNPRYVSNRRDEVFKKIKQYLEHNNPDLLVMDYTLVGQHDAASGIFLAKSLRENCFDQPIIFLSRLSLNDIRVIKEYPKVTGEKQWMQKGYRNKRILDKGYIKDELIPEIDRLLKRREKADIEVIDIYIEKLCQTIKIEMHEAVDLFQKKKLKRLLERIETLNAFQGIEKLKAAYDLCRDDNIVIQIDLIEDIENLIG